MAAGLSKKQIYGISYRAAHKIARQLVAAFPGPEMYDISAEGTTCYAHYTHVSGYTSSIRIFYSWGNMSNGESVGQRRILIIGGMVKDQERYEKEQNGLRKMIETILNTFKVR